MVLRTSCTHRHCNLTCSIFNTSHSPVAADRTVDVRRREFDLSVYSTPNILRILRILLRTPLIAGVRAFPLRHSPLPTKLAAMERLFITERAGLPVYLVVIVPTLSRLLLLLRNIPPSR